MKKIRSIIFSLLIAGACSGITHAADFTPLNFSDASYTPAERVAVIDTSSSNSVKDLTTQAINSTGSKNMQSAITELDNAQVEVRNELLNYKTKYSEIDAQYNKVKTERANLSKKIRSCEKKINQLDKAKEKIRKNMQ